MGHRSDAGFHALHVVRLRGRVTSEALGEAIGDDAEPLLRVLAHAGLVVHRDGRAAGWSLTPAGRNAHIHLLNEDRAAADAEDIVRAGYSGFLTVNTPFLAACTRWQLRADGAPNDHTDAAYDQAVIDELGGIDATVQPVCIELAGALERFARYGPRLDAALARVCAGDWRWFTSPALDSYHTVWFELHEDLLQTLGLQRGNGH